jgi:hypothetical protein
VSAQPNAPCCSFTNEVNSLAYFRDHSAIGITRSQPFELSKGGHCHRAIRDKTDIGLKISEGCFGQGAKDPVHPTGVKTQEGEGLLEHDDVITAQVWATNKEESVA